MTDQSSIGRVFTPLPWAQWLLEQTGLFDAWLKDANVLDPTCGDGAFLEAFISLAHRRLGRVAQAQMRRLHGIEICSKDKGSFIASMKRRYDVEFPEENFIVGDFLTERFAQNFDAVVGNPPWVNYTELPDALKHKWGDQFVAHGLVRSKKDVLLGSSRADLATLVLKKAIDEHLRLGGVAAFYIPLSIFFNSGANDEFRPYPGSVHGYRVSEVWDFGGDDIFGGVATRYGAAVFQKGLSQTWPVKTHVRNGSGWQDAFSTASDKGNGHWVKHEYHQVTMETPPAIGILEHQKPRQGINTCGANDIFIFEKYDKCFKNGLGEITIIEEDLMFPLVNRSVFVQKAAQQKWILVPHHNRTGKPLDDKALMNYPSAYSYLQRHYERLRMRKGILINAHIKRGLWWSLLGVGPYSFASWKVIWEALGRKEFRPQIIEGRWQGNQALHAFCPCETLEQANALCSSLQSELVEAWLKSSGMEGTCNWAQPGRIGKLLVIQRPDDLFSQSDKRRAGVR